VPLKSFLATLPPISVTAAEAQPSDLALHARCNHYRTRLGKRLRPRSAIFGTSLNISLVASITTGPVSMPIRAASAGVRVPSFLRFNSVSDRCIARGCAHSSFGIVLLGHRIAEQRYHAVAQLLGDFTADIRYCRRRGIFGRVVGENELYELFFVRRFKLVRSV
jgi:hypothetical protein